MERARTKQPKKSFHLIRPNECEQVGRIAGECFRHIGVDFVSGSRLPQWSPKRRLWEPLFVYDEMHKGYLIKVLSEGNELVGYISYFRTRKALVIDEVGVVPMHRRRGFAKYMVESIKSSVEADAENATSTVRLIGARVAENNLPAQLLFQRCGFRWIRTIPHHMPGHDTYAMQYDVEA